MHMSENTNHKTLLDLIDPVEDVLTRIARAGLHPITYGQLSALVSGDDRLLDPRLMGRVLDLLVVRTTQEWTKYLPAFVVNASTGKAGDGWARNAVPGLTPEDHRKVAHRLVCKHFRLLNGVDDA